MNDKSFWKRKNLFNHTTLLCYPPPHQTLLEKCMLSNNIMDYMVVAQGKTSIPGVDDGEECELTDVRL